MAQALTIEHHRQIFSLKRPFLRDVNDDMVLEVAVKGQCSRVGTFNSRLLHRQARELAEQESISTRQLVATSLAEKMSALMTSE